MQGMSIFLKARNGIIGFLYKRVLKRALFRLDPERVHDSAVMVGSFLGRRALFRVLTRVLFGYSHPSLAQTVAGIRFENPVGLAAGFDKNAQLTSILPAVGFGYEEIGSVTGEPCAGNRGRHLWRLPKSQGLVVYYGLKNDGCEAISQRMEKRDLRFPVGISIAKTNDAKTVEEAAGIRDYVKAYLAFRNKGIGDYFTVNISCPNAFGGEPFTDPDKLERLLSAIRREDPAPGKPIFLKLPAELPSATIDRIVEVSRRHAVTGFVCTNLAKDRSNPAIKEADVPDVGGISGKVVQGLSDDLISYLFRKHGREFVLVGCGGIFTAEDAYAKIKKGAMLLQLITGMIYEGPQAISSINAGLVELLKKDGYAYLSQAIGTEA